jgi:predicted  nucleic acid-binding Zn-ribbon protein
MAQQNLAAQLSLLATEADSVEKALVQARAELARERERRKKVEAQSQELREQLSLVRKRAETAERELGKISSSVEAESHKARVRYRELQARLEQAQQVNEVLKHELEQTETERHALETNLQEVLGNLRHAAQKAGPRLGTAPTAEDATLVPSRAPDNGW